MSTDLTQIKNFNKICQLNPTISFERLAESQPKILKVVFSVISYIQNFNNEIDEDQASLFAEKIGFINDQFNEQGRGTPFTVGLCALQLFSYLRGNPSFTNQDILNHPLFTELAAQDTIQNPIEVAIQLADFQENVLNPAILEIETPEELAQFRELIEILTEITSKIEDFDQDGTLERLREDTVNCYNYKLVSIKPSYQRLVSYEHGSIEDLSTLTKLYRKIAHIANGPYMPTEDKVAIYHAYLQIQTEFGEHGDALNDVIAALETTLGLHQGIKSGFPLELQDLLSKPLLGELGSIATKLITFEADHLIPALEQVTSREELAALEPLAQQCTQLASLLIEATGDETLNQTHSTMVELYSAKFYKTHKMYVRLMAYKDGTISRNLPEKRETMAASVNDYIQDARHCLSHPLFSPEEKIALYETILTIQNELREFGEEDLLDPAVSALGEKLSISEPERPTAKKGIFAFWEEQTSGSVSRETPPKRTSRIRREEISPEIRHEQCIQRIQEGLANLDLGSNFLKEDISDLKREIKTLQRLSDDPARFAHLETALNTLLNPTSLSISAEESVFMTLLGKKCGLSDLQLANYQLEEDVTVREGLSELLGELQAAVGTPESLDAIACYTLKTVTANAKQNRFRRFTDHHSLRPSLGQNFILHYPALVQTFELYSREIVVEHLEEAWGQIEEYYDSQSEGRFSELLVHYSYMNPRASFPDFVQICQEAFFQSLTLKKIDRLELGDLESYLTRKIEACKTHTATLFQTNYENYFLERHHWLARNFDKVTMPYNQGDHDNTNLESGVCYNNCLFRMSALMQSPELDRTTLEMGSTEKTRFYQNQVRRKFQFAESGLLSWDEAVQANKESCQAYGLKFHHEHNISTEGNLHQNLADEIERFYTLRYEQVVLGLRKPSGSGHAVNLIFNATQGIYSIEDDNLGRIDFSSLDELQEEAKTYFAIYYDNYPRLSFETYALDS